MSATETAETAASGRATDPVPEHPWGDRKALMLRARKALTAEHPDVRPLNGAYFTRDELLHVLLVHGIAPESS